MFPRLYTINLTQLTAEELCDCLVSNGYHVRTDELEFAKNNNLIKCLGVTDGCVRYLTAHKDFEDEDLLLVTVLKVYINFIGKIVAEYEPMPRFEATNIEELHRYFDQQISEWC